MYFLASYEVLIDLQASQLKAADLSYQMVCEGEWVLSDIRIPAGYELVAPATTSPKPGHDPIMIGAVSTRFTQKFT